MARCKNTVVGALTQQMGMAIVGDNVGSNGSLGAGGMKPAASTPLGEYTINRDNHYCIVSPPYCSMIAQRCSHVPKFSFLVSPQIVPIRASI